MILLQNRFLVSALAVTAGALVISHLIWPSLRASRSRTNSPQLHPAIASTFPVSTNSDTPPNSLADQAASQPISPVVPVDWVAAAPALSDQIQSQRRDPFRSRSEPENQAAHSLLLNGVWRQKDGNLAVINDHLVGEGDQILDYRIEKIEPDRVWITGPNGREALAFRSTVNPVTTPP